MGVDHADEGSQLHCLLAGLSAEAMSCSSVGSSENDEGIRALLIGCCVQLVKLQVVAEVMRPAAERCE